jgi:hypothetical protein
MRLLGLANRCAVALLIVASSAPAAAQPFVVGPYEFSSEKFFAQTATFAAYTGWAPSQAPRILPVFDVLTVEEALTGYGPETGLFNVGDPCGTTPCSSTCPPPEDVEVVELGFELGYLPLEGPGADIILFDARFSANDYLVSVRPVGGAFLEPVIYPSGNNVPTGVTGPGVLAPAQSVLWGVEVDFDDFDIAPGTPVDAVRAIGDCAINPQEEEGARPLGRVLDPRRKGGRAE